MKIPVFLLTAALLSAAPLAQHDRDRMLSELQASRKMFIDSVGGLSHDQWVFKAGPDRWSIQETAEHIATAEPFMRGVILNQVMKTPANPEMASQRAPKNDAANEQILKGLTDRTQKFQAPEPLKPKDLYADPKAAIAAFDKERNVTLDFVRTTDENMRDHFFKSPVGGDMDAVQWMIFLCGHTERHIEQIQEVKQSPKYPRS